MHSKRYSITIQSLGVWWFSFTDCLQPTIYPECDIFTDSASAQEWPQSIVCEYMPAADCKVTLIKFMGSKMVVFATNNNLVRNFK